MNPTHEAALLGLSLLLSIIPLLLFKRLPERMAVQLDIDGQPNLWMSKKASMLLAPGACLLTWAITAATCAEAFALRLWIICFVGFVIDFGVMMVNLGHKRLAVTATLAVVVIFVVGFFFLL